MCASTGCVRNAGSNWDLMMRRTKFSFVTFVLVAALTSNANIGSASGSNPLSTPPVPRPNRHGMPLWRLHESTRKFMINMHRSQNAFQLDSGETSKKLALEAIAKQFYDECWTAPIRFRDDTNLSQTIKVDPNFHPKQVDPHM
mmetsp:Transcript_10153/g.33855  ORF Transcript_10153/g.33855 Transcript_10153/m.33855 type:complete len:143 (+) Transcript_10153:64-492(+)